MPSMNPLRAWRSFLALPNSTPAKTIGVAFLIALTCSIIVSFTAVTLKPLRDANQLGEGASTLIEVLGSLGAGIPTARLVERSTGGYAAQATDAVTELDGIRDTAGLGRVDDVLTVYELRKDGRLELVVLPVRGAGFVALMHGYLVLRSDLNTIAALTFYQQDETPGMGERITEKKWQALWADKQIADQHGVIRIAVARGEGEGLHEVDGISGATRTGSGVTNLVRFWLGPDGYGPYLDRLKQEGGS